jgi:hypothetical protein
LSCPGFALLIKMRTTALRNERFAFEILQRRPSSRGSMAEEIIDAVLGCDVVELSRIAVDFIGGLIASAIMRTNRHIIGSQNDLIYLLRGYLEDAASPLEGDQLRKVEVEDS